MKRFLLIILILTLVCGCANSSDKNTIKNEPEYKELMDTNDYIIVDVRTTDEYNSGHVIGAINIPVNEIDENIDLDKSKLIFVYCLSGGRSQNAYEKLIELGYNAYNLGAYENIDLPKEEFF